MLYLSTGFRETVENLDNPKNNRRPVSPKNYAAPLNRFKES